MKVKLELELPEAIIVKECLKKVAESTPIGLLAQPLFEKMNQAINIVAKEKENGKS